MTRTKLADRQLPDYTRSEEQMNALTHICGAALGICALVLCLIRSASRGSSWGCASSAVYGGCMIALYAVSSIYHGLRPCLGKKVMQVIDHCTIYFLIAGTYTPIVLCAIRPQFPLLGWGLLALEWGLAIPACVLTAIDLRKYNVFSMCCYIGMGWAVIPFARQTMTVMTAQGFALLLWGGIAYTIGAVLYGIGSQRRWMHTVFHIFVVLGSFLQFLAVLLYAI